MFDIDGDVCNDCGSFNSEGGEIMKGYVHNVRCDECGKLYKSDSIIPASHYNSFKSYCCGGCGATGEFDDCYEVWCSVSVWFKPWTWWKGEWRSVK